VNFIETYGKEIVSLAVPLVTWVLNTFFRARARLVFASPHGFTFLVQQPLMNPQGVQVAPSQSVQTRSHVIINVGKETATKVEWVFNWKPLCVNVWPLRHFVEHVEPDGRYVMVFESLAPQEHVRVEIFSINADCPQLMTLRSDQCVAHGIEMYPQPAVANWKRKAYSVLQFVGLGFIVYSLIVLIQFLVLKTPF
jgi:hypothetical protein